MSLFDWVILVKQMKVYTGAKYLRVVYTEAKYLKVNLRTGYFWVGFKRGGVMCSRTGSQLSLLPAHEDAPRCGTGADQPAFPLLSTQTVWMKLLAGR